MKSFAATAVATVMAVAMLAGMAAPSVRAQDKATVPAGGDPALVCGQKPEGRAYWTEYAFCDLPLRGPGRAKGLILWSHGVSADKVQYTAAAPPMIRRLAQAGWDVIKINRNNLHERCAGSGSNALSGCWTAGGTRHVDDLIDRATRARAQGYDRIIAAGQSFGGAISLEANAKANHLFYAVIATSPGHGSDAESGSNSRNAYYTLDKMLLDTLSRQRSGRVIVSLPPGDALHPNRDGDPIWPKARQALQGTGVPFVLLGEGMGISGHGAVRTNQFSNWFGKCLQDFIDPAQSPAAGETGCQPPSATSKFLLPSDLKVPSPGPAGPARWLGAWQGTYAEDRRGLAIVVEKIDGATASIVYAVGSGPNRDLSMGYDRYAKARVSDDTLTIDRGNGRSLELKLTADGNRVDGRHKSADGKLTLSLQRADRATLQ